MAQSYTRQSTFVDGDTITAALFNDEYNQLENAFTYSSSSASSTGHRHDGTAGHGGNVHTIGDLDFLNKVVVDGTNNRVGFFVEVSSSAVEQIRVQDGAIVPVTDNDIDLGTSSLEFKDAYFDGTVTTDALVADTADINGGTIDGSIIGGSSAAAGSFTTIAASGAITGSSTIEGTTITATTAFVPDASDGAALGTSSLEFSDLFLADGAVVNFGDDQDVTLTHVADTGLLLNSTMALQFNDASQYINAPTATVLNINATDEIELNATNIDINGAVDVSSNLAVNGNLSVTGNATISGNLTFGDSASDTVAFSADVASTLLPSADNSFDLGASGSEWRDLYIDGTAYIDTLDLNGTAITATAAELNIMDGVTSTAAELNILDGVTSTAAELNILDGVTSTAAELNILDGVTSTTAELNILDGVTSTTAELNILDGATVVVGEINALDLGSTAVGTAIASKAVILDSNKDYTGVRNFTITGELDAATLDISGDADIDGTLEADAITIGGVTLAETIADTVGAMVSSNTESGITVSYEDADNTLDFTVGTLNQDTTGTADNFTVSANNSTDETVYPVFVDGATGSQGAETDTGLTYNPSTGLLTATGFSGNLTGTLQTAAQTNITSLGTLTALTGGTGDFNWDSNTLVVDSSANRVGILNASPDVTLDIGSATDAVHVPVGTTAQRPTGAAGYFRYNSTTSKFEGYTDSWGSIGGGSGTNMDTNIFAGDGSDTTFTLSNAPDDEQNLMVFVDGVFQAHDAYSVSGTTLTFSAAPANGRVITVYHSTTTVGGSNNTINTMTGDNSDTTLTLSVAPVHENNVQVYFDGVYQSKSNYSISGTTLTFSTAPPTGVLVEAITNTNTSSTTANQLLDADSDTKIQVEESSDEDKIRFDVAGTEEMVMDATGIVINDGSNDRDFRIESNGNANMLFVDGGNDRVGIGTASPTRQLTIENTLANSGGVIGLTSSDSSTSGTLGIIHYGNSTDSSLASINGIADGATDAGALVFKTEATGGSIEERMRINSSGNVGIGTASPTSPNSVDRFLHIHDADHSSIVLSDDQNTWEIVSNNSLTVRDGTDTRLTIDSSGNVGIGISPAARLHAYSTSAETLRLEGNDEYTYLSFRGTVSSSATALGLIGYANQSGTAADLNIENTQNGAMTFATNDTIRMTIDANGHVTMPLQSSVGVTMSTQNNMAATATTLDFDGERFDQNGDFNTGTNTFTAPVTGKYLITVNLYMKNIDQAASYYQLYLVTSNKTYYAIFSPLQFNGDVDYWDMTWTGVVDMDASDVAFFQLNQSGGAAQTDYDGQSYASFSLLH